MVLMWELTILKLRNFKVFCEHDGLIINELSILFKKLSYTKNAGDD